MSSSHTHTLPYTSEGTKTLAKNSLGIQGTTFPKRARISGLSCRFPLPLIKVPSSHNYGNEGTLQLSEVPLTRTSRP